jgi:hypothetical protein
MAIAYADIAQVLGKARRRHGRVVLATALCGGLAATLVILLAGAALLAGGVGALASVRHVTFALAGVALAAAAAWASFVMLGRASSPRAVAEGVGQAAPELKSDLLSAVELEDVYEELTRSGRYSVALVDAHVARTAERASGLDLKKVVPSTAARRAGAFFLGAVVLNALVVAVAPRALGAGWQRLAGLGGPEPVRRAEPITGDIEITYAYPAYMKREPKTLSGTGGEISAPKGTEVRLETRADRPVEAAEIVIEYNAPDAVAPAKASEKAPAKGAPEPPAAPGAVEPPRRPPVVYRLEVKNGRDLSGRFLVDEGGTYLFRFTQGRKIVAQGPPLPIALEPDAYPEVRITAPAEEIEVDVKARVHVEWSASDDVGLSQLVLVAKPPAGDERRTVLRSFDNVRREAGVYDLDLTPYRLAEGEQLQYWLEALDNDVISGPKRASSATHVVKMYSEAEHHHAALAKAQALWEELVRLLGDRIELFNREGDDAGREERTLQAQALDGRTKALHENLRALSRDLRVDRAVPREIPAALANVAGSIRPIEQALTSGREAQARMLRQHRPDSGLQARVADLDRQLDRELEKDALYLEQLFDKQRADDLLKMARDLAARRRDMASLLEKYRQSPSEQAKKELLADLSRMKARMMDLMKRMAELAKGLNDEHMNQEALAELAKQRDALGGLDQVEKMLAKGDVEGAMKALDQLGNAMQNMLSSLERTAGRPGQENAELMKDMLAFKKQLEELQSQQEALASETEGMKTEYRKRISEKLKRLEDTAKKLEDMTGEARKELSQAEKGVGARSEDDFAQSRDRLADLQRALQARDFDAALETARRALPALQRLEMGLEDDATIAERYRALQNKDPRDTREAQRHAVGALGPARKVKEDLEQLFPDPRSVFGQREQQKMSELERKQAELEQKAGQLKQKLGELSQRAPVFPPQAGDMLGGSQGHMLRAQGELGQKNPQRGHGEQRQALEDLARFKRGMEEMAKNSQQGGGGGFPLPFGGEAGGQNGEGMEASQDKVEIPGADAYRVPDEFRKDLLDAMKQGAPDAYKGEVQRYYEELVK